MTNPFCVFSWDRPFLPDLKDFLDELTLGQPGKATIIVPHQRPWKYLVDLYKADKKPVLLPKVIPVMEAIGIWRASSGAPSLHMANELDQAAKLRECINKLARNDAALESVFSRMELSKYFPWGLRLASLLDEIFREGLIPPNLNKMEDELPEPAAALLGSLHNIALAWRDTLLAEKWTTPGFDCYLATQSLQHIPKALEPSDSNHVVIAGFGELNRTEDQLFKILWQNGARICLHSDINLFHKASSFPECESHANWIASWKADVEIIFPEKDVQKLPPSIKFFAGYDVHSQLQHLAKSADLQKDSSTALILLQEEMLMPTLHHLPMKDVNISMGYPLMRTPLGALLSQLFELHKNREKLGGYHWRDFLKIIRHPYVKMLEKNGQDGKAQLRPLLFLLDAKARQESKIVDINVILNDNMLQEDAASYELLKDTFKVLIDNFSAIETLGDLAGALDAFCELFIENGQTVLQRFPLDSEALGRLSRSIIPLLADNYLANESLADSKNNRVWPILISLMHPLFAMQRIPFEADPLVGIQLLGLLETRLLNFKNIFFIDATDDRLPGHAPQDPLLPDSLRPLLGLPDAKSRRRQVSYNLARLCAGAENVNFLWQESATKTGELFEDKKSRSRYIEKLVWQKEKDQKKLCAGENDFIIHPQADLNLPEIKVPEIAASPALRSQLDKFLEQSISVSRLNLYLQCPLKFLFSLSKYMKAPEEVEEGEDAAKIGNLVHNSLKKFYLRWLNKELKYEDEADLASLLTDEFRKELDEMKKKDDLPIESFLWLELAGPARLENYLDAQNKQVKKTFIKGVESDQTANFNIVGKFLTLKSRYDRLDIRDGKLHVLDYKTGSQKNFSARVDKNLFRDDTFFEKLKLALENESVEESEEIMNRLREDLPSFQLAAYVAMLAHDDKCEIGGASIVDLYDSGKELPIFKNNDSLSDEERKLFVERCNLVTSYVLLHLLTAQTFNGILQPGCEYCENAPVCKAWM